MQFALQYARWRAYSSKQNDKRNRGFDDTSFWWIPYLQNPDSNGTLSDPS